MISSRWDRVFALFDAALAAPAAERNELLARECRDNARLRVEVESLLAAHDDADGFLSASFVPAMQSGTSSPSAARILASGTRIGVFEIERFAGAGGMGQVYCARDTRLGRRVALKVLSPEGATDPRRRARLAYEARAIAQLSHPHICALHDLGHHEGVDFLVMEYLKGETLAARLRRGPLPLDEALRIAIQISAALEAAHAEGIVHSDLKPANVMLVNGGSPSHDGPHLKLLDFGLARFQRVPFVSEPGTPGAELSGMSGSGVIAGTLQYMAPEQLRGDEADPRSDIFSLGCVMYEMVSGRAPFADGTAHDVMSAILGPDSPEPAFTESRSSADFADAWHRFEKVTRRCLEKAPERRFDRIRDVKLELEEIARTAAPVHERFSKRWWMAAIAGVATIATIIAWELRPSDGRSPALPEVGMKVVQLTALNGLEIAPTFSPDGTQVAFSWNGEREDNYDIYVQTIGSSDVRRLTTDPATDSLPTWSPDGQEIAFLRDHPLGGTVIYSVRPDGRGERKLSDFRIGGGPSARIAWSPDGRAIVGRPDVAERAANDPYKPLYLIPLDGGIPRRMTGAKGPDLDQSPAFSPDGRRLAYVVCSGVSRRVCAVDVIDLREDYSPAGPPRRVVNTGRLVSSVAWTRDGMSVVYCTNARGPWELWRASLDGATAPERLEIPGEHSRDPAIAPAGNRLAFERLVDRTNVFALHRDAQPEPVLVSSTSDDNPQFSPDGRRIAFSSRRSGDVEEIWVALADGSGARQLTHGPGRRQTLPAWSPDGREIAFESTGVNSGSHIWVIPADGGTPRQETNDPGEENAPMWSRDGKRIYFLSNRDVRDLWPDTWQVPAEGGTHTRVTEGGSSPVKYESADGKALVYQNPILYESAAPRPFAYRTLGDTPLMAVPIGGGTPRQLVPCVKALSFAVTGTGVYFSPCGSRRDRNQVNGSIQTWLPGADIPIQVLDPSTGRVRTVGTVKAPFDSARLAVSPDGKRILIHRNTQASDLMLIENFR
jgi:Tol biopolymer transport system component/serine/threonine protein kinase